MTVTRVADDMGGIAALVNNAGVIEPIARLADAAQWMGLERDDAIQWLMNTARQVAGQWAPMLRAAAGPVIEDAARLERLVGDVRPSFAYAEWLAQAS